MLASIDESPRSPFRAALLLRVVVLLALFGLLGGPVPAQEGETPEPPEPPTAPSLADPVEGSLEELVERYERLINRLEDGFDLEEVDGGLELVPENDRGDFDSIRIGEGRVSVDGERLESEELSRFVDEAARDMLELAELAERIADEGGIEELERRLEREQKRRDRRERRRHRTDTQVSFGSGLTIDRDESTRDVVLIGGSLEVLGEVEGDATVVLGSADVSGRIDGSLVVVGGSIRLREGAEVDGDVTSVGGTVEREGDVIIDGEIIQVDVGEAIDVGDVRIDLGDWDWGWPEFELFGFSAWDLISRGLKTTLVAMCLVVLAFLAPFRVRRIGRRVELEPWKSLLVGLISLVLFPALLLLVIALLALSIVGIPLLVVVVPLMLLLLVLLYLLGFTGATHTLGRFLEDRFGGRGLGVIALVLLGLVLVDMWSFLGEIFSLFPWPFKVFALVFLAGGFCLKFIVWTIGLGAAVLEQFAPLPAEAVGTLGLVGAGTGAGAGSIGSAPPPVPPVPPVPAPSDEPSSEPDQPGDSEPAGGDPDAEDAGDDDRR